MPFRFPALRVGDPLQYEGLSIFPLFCVVQGEVEYRLSDEAVADGSVVVEEVSEAGSVPDLLVVNNGGMRVLFLEGEELIGAKQNRVLNTSVLVPAHSKLRIPVSCVERGRWGYTSRSLEASGSHAPSKLRRTLKSSVSRALRQQRGHRSDQGEVWREVASLHASHDVASDTASLSDAFDTFADRIVAFQTRLNYVEGAAGMAVGIGQRIVLLDAFDKPATCRKLWQRLLSGVFFDALEAKETGHRASVADVERLLAIIRDLPWEPANAVGEGVEFRAVSPHGDHASVLVFEASLVHASVVAAM